MTERPPLPDALTETKLIAILRAGSAHRFADIGRVLVDEGFHGIEVTLNSGGALAAIEALRAAVPASVVIGAGTVTTMDEAVNALDAGAQFLVSPHTDSQLVSELAGRRVAYIPGAATATEILTAWRAGAAAVKVFPAGVFGPAYLAALRGPFPQISLVPTGGVEIEMVPALLDAGAIAVGLGAPLQGDAADGGSLARLAERARHAVAQVEFVRSRPIETSSIPG